MCVIQGLCDVVHTPPSLQQTRQQPDPVITNQPSGQTQPQGHTHQATQADFDTDHSANSQTALHPSTSRQSPVTTSAISPQVFRASHMQSQGLSDVVHMSPAFQQTSHQPVDPVDIKPPSYSIIIPNRPSALTQPPQGLTHQATQPNHGISTANKPQRKTMYASVNLTPSSTSSLHSDVLDVEQLRKKVKRTYTSRGRGRPASGIRPPSSTPPREQSGDATSKSQMRGCLSGQDLEAARLQSLLVRQPIRANEPWSTARVPLSMALPTQPNANSQNM
ncbi:uncharacterized protein [Rutidosis leptorrhynchoides]|uniref:uncharacterized protein n=1 Tax=Rutidosis leptorrhynchoides TaxID=125765 RepID=UPI003A98CEB5